MSMVDITIPLWDPTVQLMQKRVESNSSSDEEKREGSHFWAHQSRRRHTITHIGDK